MEHRGPDGAGLWPSRNVARPHALLGHRRLSIVELSEASAQPFVVRDSAGKVLGVLVYNGELYNTRELQSHLGAHRDSDQTRIAGDTYTLAHVLAMEGCEAISKLRGMYAFAWLDYQRNQCVLARDPLGIKPLLFALEHAGSPATPHVLFASEMPALLELRSKVCPPEPDLAVVSAYLSTIRTTLGNRTLMQGVHTLLPGEVRTWDLHTMQERTITRAWQAPSRRAQLSLEEAAELVRASVSHSVHAHLQADVPLCSMLSGGLDSTIITQLALQHGQASKSDGSFHTYCARSLQPASDPQHKQDADFASELAKHLRTHHHEASLDADGFLVRWAAMVHALGNPLSTPNETAIFEVLRLAREHGHRVALSGEGADELFGGYTLVLHAVERAIGGRTLQAEEHASIALESGAWVGQAIKSQVLSSAGWSAVQGDDALRTWSQQEFASLLALDEASCPLGTHLRWQRRVNLAGLLQRLDTSAMLASIEGRTPFADIRVAELAESLPMHTLVNTQEGKIVLRRAFDAVVPRQIAARPKASFPLPFQKWMQPLASTITSSPLLRQLVREPVLAVAAQRSEEHWNLAWPLANLALWEQRWWPARSAHSSQSVQLART